MFQWAQAGLQTQINALGLRYGVSAVRVKPAHEGRKVNLPDYLAPAILEALNKQKYSDLYSHQAEAIEAAVLRGEDVILTTPTASGKSLAFQVPMVNAAVGEQQKQWRSLYLAPTKALIADQQIKFRAWARLLAEAGIDLRVVTISGDVPGDRAVLLTPAPDIVLSNPDSINGLLAKQRYPQFTGWKRFLRELRFIVLDEAHACEGIFGCNVANLIARIKLAVRRAGGDPEQLQFVVASATVGNPQQVWQMLCGRTKEHPHTIVSRSGAAFAGRIELFCNGKVGSRVALCRLLNRLIEQGKTTIVFVESRRLGRDLTNLLRREQKRLGRSTKLIDQFHGTLSAQQRQDVTTRIRAGNLKIVVATSALEQGVDFPQIEVAVVWGFPDINRVQQRFGRAGRGDKPGIGIFIPNLVKTIDQYYARRGKELADAKPSPLHLNPQYLPRLKQHILAAAGESGISVREELMPLFGEAGVRAAQSLKQESKIWAQNGYLLADPRSALQIPIRGSLIERVQLLELIGSNQSDLEHLGAVIEEFSKSLALREVHPGAIYASYDASGNFRKWQVKTLNLAEQIALAEPINPDSPFSTKPIVDLKIKVDSAVPAQSRVVQIAQIKHKHPDPDPLSLSLRLTLEWGEITQSVIGYETLISRSLVACINEDCSAYNRLISHSDYCPTCNQQLQIAQTESETIKETRLKETLTQCYQAPILKIQADPNVEDWLNQRASLLRDQLYRTHGSLPPWHEALLVHPAPLLGLHTLAHLLLLALPIQSQPTAASDLLMPNLGGSATIILFDEAALGTGTCEFIYEQFEKLLQTAYHLAAECDCAEGCPKCCHTNHCGARNGAIHRLLGEAFLALLSHDLGQN